ncbi:MAG: SIS domain-containing protein [Candidatus Lokiarchaeota archaeon]|nr:SIS domain-containing protein [Candidatus Lokiarchaeota archaeon]MBD3338197.1 SIS domain-containing protein [Candidatus Lokiarchaeota archaeon]
MMSSHYSFFRKAYEYMVTRIENSLQNLDMTVMERCLNQLYQGRLDKRVTVCGAGRSLQSVLLLGNELENVYGVRVNQVSNANLRPLKAGDFFIVNSHSGSRKVLKHAKFACSRGLNVIFITGNENLLDEFENVILIKDHLDCNKEFAPLGTEFEQASAVLCSCMGFAYNQTDKLKTFNEGYYNAITGLTKNLKLLEEQEEFLLKFVDLIEEYLDIENNNVVYFKGVGINEIISRVIAIRYGHLHKNNLKDLRVVYEGHWRSRKTDDLAIFLSGSGETDQTIKYARQAGDIGMKLFTITSFKESSLASMNTFYKNSYGNLIIEGRPEMISYFNKSLRNVDIKFFPQFELNTYVTLDSLLALIAKRNDITEEDMKKTHRDRELE